MHACACVPVARLVSSTDIVEMEWKGKKFNLTVRKSEALKAAEPVYQVCAHMRVQPGLTNAVLLMHASRLSSSCERSLIPAPLWLACLQIVSAPATPMAAAPAPAPAAPAPAPAAPAPGKGADAGPYADGVFLLGARLWNSAGAQVLAGRH